MIRMILRSTKTNTNYESSKPNEPRKRKSTTSDKKLLKKLKTGDVEVRLTPKKIKTKVKKKDERCEAIKKKENSKKTVLSKNEKTKKKLTVEKPKKNSTAGTKFQGLSSSKTKEKNPSSQLRVKNEFVKVYKANCTLPGTNIHSCDASSSSYFSSDSRNTNDIDYLTSDYLQFRKVNRTEDLIPFSTNTTIQKNTNVQSNDVTAQKWTPAEYLADSENLEIETARTIIQLFEEKNTIPFIARYRNDLIGNLKPDKLRKVKETYEYILEVSSVATALTRQILQKKPVESTLIAQVQSARTLEELEFLGAAYKPESKGTLAERAKKLGLDKPAQLLLQGFNVVLSDYVDERTKGLENVNKVRLGIQHVIANIISKDKNIVNFIKTIEDSSALELKSDLKDKSNINSKYNLYDNFSQSLLHLKPHQILAINRGESEKELSVNIVVPEKLWHPLKNYCFQKWDSQNKSSLCRDIINDSVKDAIKRLLQPLVIRHARSRVNKKAEKEAIKVFSDNLKQLLLTAPCPGKIILGIDPGFKNGCKMAVISCMGGLLTYDKFFLEQKSLAAQKISNLIFKYKVNLIALGNGVGCRETETFLSDLIQKGVFFPNEISYTIVSEQGVSIYSCSPNAFEEFPDVEPVYVSAISLARRLQNPLSELVKVEPKHLGVGMYQHDVGEKKLASALDEIVSECVSFVGVDINSASLYLLRYVAGLNESKAKEIIKYRNEICSFRNREDLKNVKGISTKTFQQCAGFIRIIPSTAKCSKHLHSNLFKMNPLDETPIHPESYDAVSKLIKTFNLEISEIGSPAFISALKNILKTNSTDYLKKMCNTSDISLSFIFEVLTQPKNFDLRSLSQGPIFRQEIKQAKELSKGQVLTGIVNNIVSFGAFVDVGIGFNGLIHVSKMKNQVLNINDKVTVTVLDIDEDNKRLRLSLISKVE